MQHRYSSEAVDRTLQDIYDDNIHSFGGIPTVFGINFAQILPVVQHGSRASIVNACLLRSYLWPSIQQLLLTKSMGLLMSDEDKEYGEWILKVQILGGRYDGNIEIIARIRLTSDTGELPFSLTRIQFPVRLAFAISINKAQGQSVVHVGIDLRVPVFTHGHLYVALSRARSVQNVKVLLPYSNTDRSVVNIVFQEALLRRTT